MFESPTELIFKCCVYFEFLSSVYVYGLLRPINYGFYPWVFMSIKSTRITLTVQLHPIRRRHLRMPHDLHHPFYILELKFIWFNIYGRSYKSVFIILNRSNNAQSSCYPFYGFQIFCFADSIFYLKKFWLSGDNLKIDLRESLNRKISFEVFRASSIPLCWLPSHSIS